MQEKELKKLNIAYWLLEHRKLLKYILIYFLIALNLFIWGIAIYQFSLFLTYRKAYNQMLNDLTQDKIDYLAIHKHNQPLPLTIQNKTIITLPIKGEYDLVAEAENQDSRWIIKNFEYKFVWSGGESDSNRTFFLPSEKKYLFVLNQKIKNLPKNFQIKIVKISYQRVRPKMRKKLSILSQLKFRKVIFSPTMRANQKIIPAQIKFQAINQSAYSFWQVNAIISIYQGSRIINLTIYPLRNWRADEKRNIEINLSLPLTSVTSIKIIPEINILDKSVFMPLNN